MKYVVVITVVLVAFWIWRNNRQSGRSDSVPPAQRRPIQGPAPMVACALCDMHLPEAEAVNGRLGVYCCHEHRRQAEEAVR